LHYQCKAFCTLMAIICLYFNFCFFLFVQSLRCERTGKWCAVWRTVGERRSLRPFEDLDRQRLRQLYSKRFLRSRQSILWCVLAGLLLFTSLSLILPADIFVWLKSVGICKAMSLTQWLLWATPSIHSCCYLCELLTVAERHGIEIALVLENRLHFTDVDVQ